jgi:phenylacetate-coenzyme A ligase PaaK-like adenylate-forming protein
VAIAARAAGFGLQGTTVRTMSEPMTDAKRRQIENAGMRVMPGYGSVETGVMAHGCLNPSHADDVHLLRDSFALIDHPYPVPGTDTVVRAFNLTALRDSSPKVMLNYQIDDHGVVERRDCGCALQSLGHDTHVHSIRSYTKLVGEGVTLVGNDLTRILEESLPSRFGGTPLDYQLQEGEDAQGLTRLTLVVSPRVNHVNDQEMIEFLLERLRASSPMADAAGTVWRGAGTLRVARREPALTERGKFHSLFVSKSTEAVDSKNTAPPGH